MKRYDERILNLLLDRYERSLLSDGRNQRTIHITERITKEHFPEYYDVSSLEYEEIHQQLIELYHQGLVTLGWKGGKEGHILEKCSLNPERIGEVYTILHRTPKDDKRMQAITLLSRFQEELPAFAGWAMERLRDGRSVRQYIDLDHPEALERVLRLAAAILGNQKDIYLRAFSIEVFHDSKIAEKELTLAISILKRFERPELPEELDTDALLEEFNIYKNPSVLFIKGFGIMGDTLLQGIGVFQDDLTAFLNCICDDEKTPGPVLYGSPETASKMIFDVSSKVNAGIAPNLTPDRILTIENLTSFHQWDPNRHMLGERELVIYLAGYANRGKREFLKALHEKFPAARFYHFGDIDCGGFRIWKNLCEETQIPVETCRMDLATFLQYQTFGRDLTAGDRKMLYSMREDPFFKTQRMLFDEMLRTNKKLEQECIV